MHKLTIITINYNNATGLKKTMESVLNQTSTDFEYIVVDGAAPQPPKGGVSQDREVIEQYVKEKFNPENGFTKCIWKSKKEKLIGGFFSEHDSGIYNAMNKGIRMAKGEFIHFLNSGDWLVDERVVEKMLTIIENQESRTRNQESRTRNQEPGTRNQEPGYFSPPLGELENAIDILVGNVISIRPDGKKRYNKNTEALSLLTFYRGTIQHTSAYIRRELFDIYGLYDESLKIVADWKWYLIVAGLNKANVQFTDICVTYFDTTGISSTNLTLDKAERRKVLEELIPSSILADYDAYHFDIEQMERIKKHRWLYRLFWFAERVYFKIDKWQFRYFGWHK